MLSKIDYKCIHRHNGYEHPCCYMKYQQFGKPGGIGFLDIETSGLQGNYNIIYCWTIKYLDEPRYESYTLQKTDYQNHNRDKELIRRFLYAIDKFSKLYVYWGSDRKFDLPFLRTRAHYWGFQFPPAKTIQMVDIYYPVKAKFRLHSNRLDVIAELLHCTTKKTPLSPEIWNRAQCGYDKEALAYIHDHNVKDCDILEEVYLKIKDEVQEPKRWL